MLFPRFIADTLSGDRIDMGNRRVRLVYIDEAGVSNPEQEPYLVVAGFILDADQDWLPLDRHIKSIMRRHLPSELHFTGVFHAKDIWHGAGNFPRNEWPRDKRNAILAELASIPARFHLPVVAGFVDRHAATAWEKEWYPEAPEATVNNMIHGIAFTKLAEDVERWMVANSSREVAMLVAENSGRMQSVIKAFHHGYRDDAVDAYFDEQKIRGFPKDLFRPRHIIDTVHFAGKRESILLQISDMCAFLIKRALMEKTDTKPFFEALKPQLISSLDLSLAKIS